MNTYLILLLAFCLGGVYPGFMEYTRKWSPELKGRHPWIYAWSGEALSLASLAILFKVLNFEINSLNLIGGTTLFVTGFGLITLVIIKMIEKNIKIRRIFSLKALLYLIYHLLCGILAIWLIVSTNSNYLDLLITLMFLLLYARLMIPKGLEVPWILYKKGSISRKTIISTVIIFLYILLPSLSLLI